MKMERRKYVKSLSVLAVVIFGTVLANGQLSTSIGGSMSQPLDSDLNGLDSSVAPTPSSEIEYGAGSLLTPEEHQLPYDAIGASLVATPMSPDVIPYNNLIRIPFQVDGSVRDATFATGLHPSLPINIVDMISRKPGKLIPSSESSLNHPSVSSLGSLPGDLPGTTILHSLWKVGGTSAAMVMNPLQPPIQTTQPTVKPSGSISIKTRLNEKASKQGESDGVNSRSTVQPEDYSRSPLEAPVRDNQSSADLSSSPFRNLDQGRFLNPDITLSASRHNASTKRSATSSSSSTQSSYLGSRTTHGSTRGALLGRDRSMKQTSKQTLRTDQVKKPRWHNPILQQMEDAANSNQH